MISQRITFLFLTCFVLMCSSVLAFPGNTIYDTRYPDHIDAKWFLEQTLDQNLLNWFDEGQAVLDNGFIISEFERDWIPRQPLQASITSQGRSIYALAVTYELTGDIKYKEMLIKAADFLQSAYKDPDYEGYVYSVDSEGNIINDKKISYGHAFVVWGFTHAYRITKDIKYLRNALYAIKVLEVDFTDEYGGFVWQYDRTFETATGTKSFNVLMHYIEALLYLYQETNLPSIRRYLSDSLNFMADKYNKEYGYIPETFDNDWNELTEGRSAVISIGHQFEWAFLLQMAVELGFPKKYFGMGETALDFAIEYGYDEVTGAVIDCRLNYSDFSSRRPVFHWCQTEALRTFAVYAAKYDREEMWEYFDRSLQYAKDHFIDNVYGGWYRFPDRINDNYHLDNYHITTMNREILRISRVAPAQPSVTTQPADQSIIEGDTATFTVVASGSAPLSYQWQKDGIDIPGANSASYTTPVTTLADDGSIFRVIVTNSIGSVTSLAATLSVTAAPIAVAITDQPLDQTVSEGASATFSVVVTGTTPFTYQWQKNGVDIRGATSVSYTTPPTTVTDNGATFQVMVSNSVNSVTSSVATLTVVPPDSNNDGLSDADAISLGLDPNDSDGDTDGDGVADVAEIGGDVNNPLDSDGDGVIDALEPGFTGANDASIASGLPLANGASATITSAGETLSDVSVADATGGPSGVNFPFGTLSYTTTSAIVGGSVTVRILFSSDLPTNLALYKVDNTGVFVVLPNSIWTKVDSRTIDMTLTDGDQLTDLDGVADGSIEDPIAPAEVAPVSVAPTPSAGGGGGGCALNTISNKDPFFPLLILVSLGCMLRERMKPRIVE